MNLFSTFGEFIFNPIDRRDKSFLSTPFQEPEAAGIVDYRGVGKREHRVDPGRGHQEPRTTILAGSGRGRFSSLLASFEERPARRRQRLGNCVDSVGWPAPPAASGGAWRYGGCGCRLPCSIKAPFAAPGDPEIEEDERVDDRQLPTERPLTAGPNCSPWDWRRSAIQPEPTPGAGIKCHILPTRTPRISRSAPAREKANSRPPDNRPRYDYRGTPHSDAESRARLAVARTCGHRKAD